MKSAGLALVVLVIVFGVPRMLEAQVDDRSVERVRAATQRPLQLDSGSIAWTAPPPRKLGVFALEPPSTRGEILRLRLPIGELLSKGAKGVSTANQRRRESSAGRHVQQELSAFIARQTAP